jgi:hypothetical protein
VTGGVLRRAPQLKEVERSEEGKKISKGNTWGRLSPRIGDGNDELADSGEPGGGFRWRSEEECGGARRRLLCRSREEKRGGGSGRGAQAGGLAAGTDQGAAAAHVARRAGRREGGLVWGGDSVVRPFWYVDVFLIIIYLFEILEIRGSKQKLVSGANGGFVLKNICFKIGVVVQ